MQFRPIDHWPGNLTKNRKRAPFKGGYLSTLKLLARELAHLKATAVVVQAAVSETSIRLDGNLRGDAKPSHPGIIVSFATPSGPMSFPCDRFFDWKDNLRAIALALDALRRVDRYGVTRRGEQYRGWRQLPGAVGEPSKMSKGEAASIIVDAAMPEVDSNVRGFLMGKVQNDRDAAHKLYRSAAAKAHPDRAGGDEALFKRIQEARCVLGI